jgi:hypothetical protein
VINAVVGAHSEMNTIFIQIGLPHATSSKASASKTRFASYKRISFFSECRDMHKSGSRMV